MRSSGLVLVCLVTAAVVLLPTAAGAQGAPAPQDSREQIDTLRAEMDKLQKDYADRMAALEARLAALEAAVTATAPAPAPAEPQAPAPAPAPVVAGVPPSGSKVFNPDMAVIGDFLGAMGRNTINPSPALEMHEAEASFQAAVDPYARADFFVAFGEEGVDLEEGFITFPTLPGGLLVKVGKMRAAVGKVNTLHNHVVTWTDRPLVTNNLLGGEEGISDAGISAAYLVPNPWLFLEATGQVFRGDSEGVFESRSRGDLSYIGHFRGYRDVNENTNLDLGFTYARGHSALAFEPTDDDQFITHIYGLDATVRWRPLQRSIYRSFVGRTEWFWREGGAADTTPRAGGWYASGDYQFARRWFAGLRFDRSDRAIDATLHDTGQSAILTFWPSEFSQVRGQYRRTRYAEDSTANEFLFQVQFSIGAHGAHPF